MEIFYKRFTFLAETIFRMCYNNIIGQVNAKYIEVKYVD